MSDNRELLKSIKEATSGLPAAFIAAIGSLATSLVHSLQTEELLYGNLLALGTVCFIVYRMIIMGLDMWLKTQEKKHDAALEEIQDQEAALVEGQKEITEKLQEIGDDLRERNLSEQIRKNRVRLEKEIAQDLPDRLKKTDGEL